MAIPPFHGMTPESQDTRLTRVEEQVKVHERDIRSVAPLTAQYAVLEEKVLTFREDLNEGLKAIREEIAEIKKANAERAKERRTMLWALFIAGVGLFGTFGAQLLQLRGKG